MIYLRQWSSVKEVVNPRTKEILKSIIVVFVTEDWEKTHVTTIPADKLENYFEDYINKIPKALDLDIKTVITPQDNNVFFRSLLKSTTMKPLPENIKDCIGLKLVLKPEASLTSKHVFGLDPYTLHVSQDPALQVLPPERRIRLFADNDAEGRVHAIGSMMLYSDLRRIFCLLDT